METWLSGRKRRFAKSVMGSNPSAGSNPVVSARFIGIQLPCIAIFRTSPWFHRGFFIASSPARNMAVGTRKSSSGNHRPEVVCKFCRLSPKLLPAFRLIVHAIREMDCSSCVSKQQNCIREFARLRGPANHEKCQAWQPASDETFISCSRARQRKFRKLLTWVAFSI